MPRLGIVFTSTRPNRIGLPVGQWFVEKAKAHGKFEIEVVDLKELALPPMDEPEHPRFRKYQHDHTKAWSRTVNALDAFVFVVPEYNHSMPPALLNAVDYLYLEWNYKAAGYVSYGGASAGTRSMQTARLVATALKIVPLPESVSISYPGKLVTPEGRFDPGSAQDDAVTKMLDELVRWTDALNGLREAHRQQLAKP